MKQSINKFKNSVIEMKRLVKGRFFVGSMTAMSLMFGQSTVYADGDPTMPEIDVEGFKTLVSTPIKALTTVGLFAVPILATLSASAYGLKWMISTERKREEMEIQVTLGKTVAVAFVIMGFASILKIFGL